MTEAPKRIWAWPDKGNPESVTGRWSCNTYSSDLTQSYILAAEHERLLTERDAEIARLREALAIAADDLEEWVLCKDSLEKAGFNMDDTAKRAEIARAALATIDAVEGERG